jgi:16S rRNA (cytosine967-C5)-methyltransferase
MRRLRLDAELIEADATAYVPAAPPDMILLDAPCSATGTLRRHPEIAHIRDEAAIGELAQQQRALLDHAIALLAPGGMLVYCTCSLEPEEGEAQIARLLEDGTAVARKPIEPHDVEGIATHITGDGDLRTLPHMSPGGDLQAHGMDGFFAARLVKA